MLRILLLSLTAAACAPTWAAEPLTYEADVRPILKAHCFQCHGERPAAEGNLDLRLRRLIVQGGDSGPAIVPGDADGSLLIERVSQGEMPPEEDQRLAAQEVQTLRRWIAAGAPTAREEPESLEAGDAYFTAEERNWWAFRPLQRPQTPDAATEAAGAIDAFLLAGLAELASQNQQPAAAAQLAPEAERTTLIRRLYLDMLGLPPSPVEVRQFVEDSRPDAWGRAVDRVLASPRYGERWARHWLDVAGYADSDGYTDEDRVRKHAWHYRDYVIRAFNLDKPYSEFITEQLAGDELVGWPRTTLRPEILDTLAATGLLRMAPDGTASAGVDQDLARNQVVADTLQIVGTAVMGMTVHCAQCHDHRYDPIPQRDYYRLRAIFEPALDWKNWQTPADRLVSLYTAEEKKQRTEIEARAKRADAKRQERVDYYIAKTLEHELLMVADDIRQPLREAFQTKPADRTAEQKQLLERHANVANIRSGSLYLYDRRRAARAADLDQRRAEKLAAFFKQAREQALDALDEATRQQLLSALDAKAEDRTEQQQQLVDAQPAASVTVETLAEFDPQAAEELERYATAAAEVRRFRIRDELQKLSDEADAIRATIPKEQFLRVLSEQPGQVPATFVFHRGDHQQPRQQVEPRGLSVLDAPLVARDDELSTSGRRLQFARYLTRGRHPLVARVFVNRLWAHHFGRGIVATTGDFGFLGERPTHPLLLDWLAAELVDSGWSVKHLHRLILTSRAYRQSAVGDRWLVAADPDNRLLGRWPLQRLESETLRDAILLTAGRLNTKMFGEPVPVMEDEVGQIVLGRENLDGERKPVDPISLGGAEFRRSVYIQVRRTRPLGMLESFDVPELAPNCPERASSNVAPQSLMLMNSDFIVKMSTAMADRLIADRGGDPAEQLRWGWQLAMGRRPNEAQMAGALEFLRMQVQAFGEGGREVEDAHRAALATYCQALLGSSRFLYIE